MKASSESGLWAILISRVLTAVRLDTFSPLFKDDAFKAAHSKIVPGFWLIRSRRPVCGVAQALAHANICGQNGPHRSPGGDSYDQKPPDHPHDE